MEKQKTHSSQNNIKVEEQTFSSYSTSIELDSKLTFTDLIPLTLETAF